MECPALSTSLGSCLYLQGYSPILLAKKISYQIIQEDVWATLVTKHFTHGLPHCSFHIVWCIVFHISSIAIVVILLCNNDRKGKTETTTNKSGCTRRTFTINLNNLLLLNGESFVNVTQINFLYGLTDRRENSYLLILGSTLMPIILPWQLLASQQNFSKRDLHHRTAGSSHG